MKALLLVLLLPAQAFAVQRNATSSSGGSGSGLSSVTTDSTLGGNGTASIPLGVNFSTPTSYANAISSDIFRQVSGSTFNVSVSRVDLSTAGRFSNAVDTFTYSNLSNTFTGSSNTFLGPLWVSSSTLGVNGNAPTSFQLGVSTLIVKGSGLVGIGNSAPVYQLDMMTTNTGTNALGFCVSDNRGPCTNGSGSANNIQLLPSDASDLPAIKMKGGSGSYIYSRNPADNAYTPIKMESSGYTITNGGLNPVAAKLTIDMSGGGTMSQTATSNGFGFKTNNPGTLLHMSSGTLTIDGNSTVAFQVGASTFVIGSTYAYVSTTFTFTQVASFTALGGTNYSIISSSGISIGAGGIRWPDGSISTSALSGKYAAPGGSSSVDNSTTTIGIPQATATDTTAKTCILGSTVTLTLVANSPVVLSIVGLVTNSGLTNNVYLTVVEDGVHLAPSSVLAMFNSQTPVAALRSPVGFTWHTLARTSGAHSYCIMMWVDAGTATWSTASGTASSNFTVTEAH